MITSSFALAAQDNVSISDTYRGLVRHIIIEDRSAFSETVVAH